MRMETGKANPDCSPTTKDITAQVIVIPIEATLDHNTGIRAATTRAVHNDLTQPTEDTAIDLAMTHHIGHIANHPNIKGLQVIDPGIAVDHMHDHPTDLQDMKLINQIHIPAGQEEDLIQEEHKGED